MTEQSTNKPQFFSLLDKAIKPASKESQKYEKKNHDCCNEKQTHQGYLPF